MDWVYIVIAALIVLWTVFCLIRHFKKKGSCNCCDNCKKHCPNRK
ncbi:MAG: FeoB-associated Cys-rich membrane protein [Clostridia bacterium]|nr:FeoB-associated Cys-rich membrane protein [Clostridia bacterium]